MTLPQHTGSWSRCAGRAGLARIGRIGYPAALAATGLTTLALTLVAPSTVRASPEARGPHSLNVSADRAALIGYRTYLASLTGGAPGAATGAGQVISQVNADCAGAASDLARLSGAQLKQSALTAFGDEVAADLQLAYIAPDAPALNRLGGVLAGLSWSSPTPATVTSHFIAAERTLTGLGASDLCADATALDAAPLSEPRATRHFLARYRGALRSANQARAAFQRLLAQFETAAETRLVSQIDALSAQYASGASAIEQTDADSVLSALGISR